MIEFKLNSQDAKIVRPVAKSLADFWDNNFAPVFSGLYCEYAAIKYFNNVLRAKPSIKFNTSYINGKDGGIDFRHADLTWDVKSTVGNTIPREQLLHSQAQIILVVQKTKAHNFKFWGFHLLGRLPNKEILKEEDFIGEVNLFKSLKEGRPQDFYEGWGETIPLNPPYKEPALSYTEINWGEKF